MTTVLVVDDYPVIRRVLSLQLRKAGYAVLSAENGRAALEILDRSDIALAIVDIAMPEMDGLSLLKRLREDHRYRELPVIMLTASGQDRHESIATSAGADAFMTKPASSHELVAAVNRLLAAAEEPA